MKVAIILNGISLKKDRFYKKILPSLQELCSPEVFETQSRDHAIQLAERAVSGGFDYILAAGGDGTIHQVVNGMLRDYQPPTKLPVLGSIPLGGGNDFARSLGFAANPDKILNALREGRTTNIDVGEVLYWTQNIDGEGLVQKKRFFVNVADVGMGPEVVRKVLASGRPLGATLAYFQSILATFWTYKPVELLAIGDGWQWHKPVRTFAVANGRYYGNGLCIAPDALLDDGEFNVFACGNVSVLDFLLKSIPLRLGKKIRHSEVSYFKARRVELAAKKGKLIVEADGEVLGELPVSVTLSDIKIRVLFAST